MSLVGSSSSKELPLLDESTATRVSKASPLVCLAGCKTVGLLASSLSADEDDADNSTAKSVGSCCVATCECNIETQLITKDKA